MGGNALPCDCSGFANVPRNLVMSVCAGSLSEESQRVYVLHTPLPRAAGCVAYAVAPSGTVAACAAYEEGLRDRDRLLVFLALVRVAVVLVGERRRTGFSVADAAVCSASRSAGPRPNPMLFASWDRCSE
jgi:hypothetical protein